VNTAYEVSECDTDNDFPGIKKMVSGVLALRKSICVRVNRETTMLKPRVYNSKHIRPLAVRPLIYPESVPNPWGFFISGFQCKVVA
jgi:hypothetical protein